MAERGRTDPAAAAEDEQRPIWKFDSSRQNCTFAHAMLPALLAAACAVLLAPVCAETQLNWGYDNHPDSAYYLGETRVELSGMRSHARSRL